MEIQDISNYLTTIQAVFLKREDDSMSAGLWLAELYFTLSSCLLEEFVSWKRARVFVPSTAKSGEQSDPQHFCGPGVRVLLLLLLVFFFNPL